MDIWGSEPARSSSNSAGEVRKTVGLTRGQFLAYPSKKLFGLVEI